MIVTNVKANSAAMVLAAIFMTLGGYDRNTVNEIVDENQNRPLTVRPRRDTGIVIRGK